VARPRSEPCLRTERLELRPIRADDLPWYAELRARDGFDVAAAEARLRAAVAHWHEHGFGKLVIFLGREPAGLIPLNHAGEGLVGIEPDEIDVGWYARPHLWGSGIAPEAARAVVEWLDSVGIGPVVVYIRRGNRASTRVAEKLGLERQPDGLAQDGDAIEIWRSVRRLVW